MLDRTYNSDFVNFTWDGSKAVFEAPAEAESKAFFRKNWFFDLEILLDENVKSDGYITKKVM